MNSKGRISFDSYVMKSLMCDLVGHDRKPSAFLVYLAIDAQNGGGATDLSYNQLADLTGLSRRAVQDAVSHLTQRQLLECSRDGATETTRYRTLSPWRH